MIKILKDGVKRSRIYIKKCKHCDCEFTYQEADITKLGLNYVVYCPCCDRALNADREIFREN